MVLNVSIEKRIATLQSSEGNLVCDNSKDSIVFAFDSEWDAHPNRTARFKWKNKHRDVEFTGDTVEIPPIKGSRSFSVGVYSGEAANGEDEISTTDVKIPCLLSTRSGESKPSGESGANYTNEARGYAEAAAQSAASAKASEEATADMGAEVQAHQAYYDGIVDMANAGISDVYVVEEGEDITEAGQISAARLAKVIALPNGLTCIGNSNFAESYVVQIKIPPSVVSIESGAFGDAWNLKRVDFNGKLQRIEGNAFGGTKVDKFKIPKSVTWIGGNALASTAGMIIDLTEFGYDTPFPVAGGVIWGNSIEATIRVPKGRKSELLSMTNWAAADYTIEEVEV